MPLKNIATRIRADQHEMLRRISTVDIPMQEHIMRALDIYLSTHAVQRDLELVRANKPTRHLLEEIAEDKNL